MCPLGSLERCAAAVVVFEGVEERREELGGTSYLVRNLQQTY